MAIYCRNVIAGGWWYLKLMRGVELTVGLGYLNDIKGGLLLARQPDWFKLF